MKNNSFLSKYKLFITPAVLLLVFAIGVIFVLRPAIKRLEEDTNGVQEKLVELDIEKEKVDELPKIKNRFMKVDAHRDELNVLFAEENIVSLVQEIEKMAEETGNTISLSVDESDGGSKKVKAKKSKDEVAPEKLLEGFSEEEYFKIDIDVMGNYEGLIKFVDRFNDLEYYNSLVSFDMVSSEEEYKEERLIDAKLGGISANANSGSDVKSTKLILKTELGIVFYLNKIADNNSSEKNGS